MKALVLYELHFFKDQEGQYWSKKLVNYEFLDRYLHVFENVTICARIAYIERADDSMMKVSGLRVDFVDLPDSKGINSTLKKFPKTRSIFKKALIEHDVLITRAPTMLIMLLFGTIKRSGKPYSVDLALSGKNMISKEGYLYNFVNNIVDHRLKKICMDANGVSYVTEYVLQNSYPCRAIKEPTNNKYFTGSFSTIEMNDQNYKKQDWKADEKPHKFIISHCGFMEDDRKCHAKVIYIVKKLVERNYNVEVKFIGDGSLKQDLVKYSEDLGIADRCHFIGLITDKQKLLDELHDSHLFVFPTKAEGLPRSVIEAMAQGLPCISSPVDGVVELLEPQFLIDWRKPDDYVEKVAYMFDNWELMIKQSKRNYNKALEYHNDSLKIKRYEFYGKLKNLGDSQS